MTYTTNQLIADAYYSSGIVTRQFESVEGNQTANALRWLNDVLSKKVLEKDLIPYSTISTFTAIAGTESYAIADLIAIDTLTFEHDSVRYPMDQRQRDNYFGQLRVNTITTLPSIYTVERTFAGATVYMYPLPVNAYVFTYNGLHRLANVALGQDLDLTINQFYQLLLKNELAARICREYVQPVPEAVTAELTELQLLVSKNSRVPDMTIQKSSTLQTGRGLSWAQVNLGRGWYPGNSY